MFNKNNNYYQFDKLEEGNFKILACFTRSFDENHKQKEMIHLISSVVLCRYSLNYKLSANFIQESLELYRNYNYSSIYCNFYNKNLYIFEIVEEREDFFDLKNPYCITELGQLTIIKLPITSLLGIIKLERDNLHINENFLSEIFGNFQDSEKKFDLIAGNSLFIFTNKTWSNIVLYFKMMGVNISGGTSPNRHLLNTVDATLKDFLDILFCCNSEFIKKYIIYESQKTTSKELVISSIPLNSYKNWIEVITNDNYNIKNFTWQQIEVLGVEIEKLLKIKNKSEFSEIEIQIYNLWYAFKYLIKSIKEIKYKERFIILENQVIKNKNYIRRLEHMYNNYNYMSVKEMKDKYKIKDREDLGLRLEESKKQLSEDLAKLDSLNKEKENIANKDEILNKIEKELKNKNIIELNQIYSEFNRNNNNNELSLKNKLNLRRNWLDIKSTRYYSTTTNSTFSKEESYLEELNNELNLTEEILKDKSKEKFDVSSIKKTQNEKLSLISPAVSLSDKNKTQTLLSFFLEDCKKIIEDSLDADEVGKRIAQLKLEEAWISLIEDRLNNDKFFVDRYQGNLISPLYSIKETLDIMRENNYFKKKFPKLDNFTDLNTIDYIVIAFTTCLTLYKRFSYNYLAINIGKNILNYIYYKEKDKKIQTGIGNPSIVNLSFEEFKKIVEITELEQTFEFGNFYLEILQRFPHELFKRKVKLDSYFTNEPYFLDLNKDYIDVIKQNIIINPKTLPMICKPNSWTEQKFGGYLTNKLIKKDIITQSDIFNHKVDNKSPIYETVNYLNKIEFGVNNLMLNYILSDEGSYLLESVKADDELQRVLTLEIAKLYSKSCFYLSTHADWRGRIYTQSFYLSYQGGDLSVSLLNFWKGEPISEIGKFYLYIYGANSHNERGIGKSSFKNRINWVKKNYLKIINLDKDLILSAESPFIFTAFCLNMKEIHNNPNHIIKTPVFLDATCSGIQHLAGLMKDIELGINTNLLPQTEDDIPEDIYNYLLITINKDINKFGKQNFEYENLSKVKLERKQIKAPIMTKVYNVTKFGMSRQLQDVLKDEEKDDKTPIENIKIKLEEIMNSNKKKPIFICKGNDGKKVELSKRDIYKMAEIINEQIFVVFPALNNIYNYFIDIAKLTSKLDIPLYWVTPNGLKITQRYLRKKKKVISVNLFSITKKVVILEKTDKIDKSKQAQAIIPNIIHSLDADHLISIIQKSADENFSPLITVHDCFGTLPNLMQDLEYKVKKEFVLLYSQNKFLKDFHQSFIQLLNDFQFDIKKEKNEEYVLLGTSWLKIPSIPKQGNLDLDNIMKSKYMIS